MINLSQQNLLATTNKFVNNHYICRPKRNLKQKSHSTPYKNYSHQSSQSLHRLQNTDNSTNLPNLSQKDLRKNELIRENKKNGQDERFKQYLNTLKINKLQIKQSNNQRERGKVQSEFQLVNIVDQIREHNNQLYEQIKIQSKRKELEKQVILQKIEKILTMINDILWNNKRINQVLDNFKGQVSFIDQQALYLDIPQNLEKLKEIYQNQKLLIKDLLKKQIFTKQMSKLIFGDNYQSDQQKNELKIRPLSSIVLIYNSLLNNSHVIKEEDQQQFIFQFPYPKWVIGMANEIEIKINKKQNFIQYFHDCLESKGIDLEKNKQELSFQLQNNLIKDLYCFNDTLQEMIKNKMNQIIKHEQTKGILEQNRYLVFNNQRPRLLTMNIGNFINKIEQQYGKLNYISYAERQNSRFLDQQLNEIEQQD